MALELGRITGAIGMALVTAPLLFGPANALTVEEAFLQVDADGNQVLDFYEFASLAQVQAEAGDPAALEIMSMDEGTRNATLQARFDDIDVDADGQLSAEEFLAAAN